MPDHDDLVAEVSAAVAEVMPKLAAELERQGREPRETDRPGLALGLDAYERQMRESVVLLLASWLLARRWRAEERADHG